MAFDVTSTIAEDSWFATLVRGMFNLRPAMAVLPVVAWFAYVVPVLVLFLRPTRVQDVTPEASAAAGAPTPRHPRPPPRSSSLRVPRCQVFSGAV